MMILRTAALLMLLSACATSRVSTSQERDNAMAVLAAFESGIAVLFATEKISQVDFNLASEQIQGLRQLVSESGVTPMSWTDVMQRVTNFSIQWLVKRN
jgi:membrane-bound lytic murein transglycosylase MltF